MASQTSRRISAVIILIGVTLASAAMFVMPRMTQPPEPSATPSPTAEQVLAYYQALVDKDPQDLQAQLALGNANFDKKAYAGAIKAYQAVLLLDPKQVNARVDMATAYYYDSVPSVAIVQFKKALEQDPDNVNALFNLGVVYHSQAQFKDAKTVWLKASGLATDPKVKTTIDERLKTVS
ncbi:MAG: tetratricopeptide repeat protein [Candidatus Sericytochromatia bacterium]|nr:tetratricopeptide repeat protein [Candidatus Sericytochromatia bacterium]